MVNGHELGPRLMQETRWAEAAACLSFDGTHLQECFECSWNLGWAHFKLGQNKDAKTHLERASILSRKSAPGAWALAAVLLNLGNLEEAEGEARRALTLGESAMARRVLALVYMKQGRLADAEAVHLESVRLFPESNERWRMYADFLSDRG